MNLERLYEILSATTVQLRKGAAVHGAAHLVSALKEGRDLSKELGGVLIIDAMPHESEAPPEFEKVDLCLLTIGVRKAVAENHKAELIALLNNYPDPDSLAGGPSYITVGAEIGDQGAAFQLFALGKVLGLWDIITPALFGMKGEEATRAAGGGYIMITGFRCGETGQ